MFSPGITLNWSVPSTSGTLWTLQSANSLVNQTGLKQTLWAFKVSSNTHIFSTPSPVSGDFPRHHSPSLPLRLICSIWNLISLKLISIPPPPPPPFVSLALSLLFVSSQTALCPSPDLSVFPPVCPSCPHLFFFTFSAITLSPPNNSAPVSLHHPWQVAFFCNFLIILYYLINLIWRGGLYKKIQKFAILQLIPTIDRAKILHWCLSFNKSDKVRRQSFPYPKRLHFLSTWDEWEGKMEHC